MTKPLSKMSRRELTDACIKGQQRSADLAAYVKRLGEERDAYQDMAQCMSFDLTSMGEERDALATHVERFAGLLRELDYTMPVTPHLPMARIKGEYLERVEQALDELPTTSLARRNALMKAVAMHEAICDLESEFDPCHPLIERLEAKEAEYRRQAEEEDQ